VVVEPEVLLLDEPLSNLDANLRVTMRRELLALQRKLGITTIFVTHDQEEANTTADRMAVLEGGVLQQIGAPIELYDSPANLFVAKFLGTANILAGEVATDGASSVFITREGKRLPLSGSHAAGPANVVLRPQNITVGMGAADTPTLRGEVAHREFLGAQMRYLVRVGDAELIVDCGHQRGAAALSIGEAIDLTVSMDQAVIFYA
jgi:iron(III) transport system ATP-binding protein